MSRFLIVAGFINPRWLTYTELYLICWLMKVSRVVILWESEGRGIQELISDPI